MEDIWKILLIKQNCVDGQTTGQLIESYEFSFKFVISPRLVHEWNTTTQTSARL